MNPMLACVDVQYRQDPNACETACAACLLFTDWSSSTPTRTLVAHIPHVEPYQPGAFYKRELPCIQAVLQQVDVPLHTILIDGYVWLSSTGQPGLGAHLHQALGNTLPIIGVAKSSFKDVSGAVPVLRGQSRLPLWVSAVGMDVGLAALYVQSMHGSHRLPTLLKRVDAVARAGGP